MTTLRERIRDRARREIINAPRACGGVEAKAARRLGITETMIGYRIRKYGVRVDQVHQEIQRE